MQLTVEIKNTLIEIIKFLFMVLFVYAATSKLLDFEQFKVQLGQSPILTAYADWIVWGIPLLELFIAGLFIFPKTRLVAFYASFILMIMFTTYILIVLNFSDYIPCSCGGVLEKLGWTEHILFNLGFLLMGIWCIFLLHHKTNPKNEYLLLKPAFSLSVLGLFGSAFVVLLFLLSENTMHRNNAFIRRFPHHPVSKQYDLDIKYNSYYFAGYDRGSLYLGNSTAPLHLLKIDLQSRDTSHIKITLETKDLQFKAINVKIQPPYFYIMDGLFSCILKGKLGEWNAQLLMKDKVYFSRALPISSDKFYIKAIQNPTRETVLGLLEISDSNAIKLHPNLLVKQIDGVFDVDGIMVSQNNGIQGYVYYYRNQFMVMDSNLDLLYKGTTIDTVGKAQLQLSNRNQFGEVTMKAPPLIINKSAAIYHDYMLIRSDRLGKYEEERMLQQASIIDVYNWKRDRYEFSFYLYDLKREKVKEFNVYDNYLVALIGEGLSVYKLKPMYFQLP